MNETCPRCRNYASGPGWVPAPSPQYGNVVIDVMCFDQCPDCIGTGAALSELERQAAAFAQAAHGAINQRRKYTNRPYFEHPCQVAAIVRAVPHTEEMIAAAFLHDVVEDCGVTIAELDRRFGSVVATYVSWLSDVSKPSDGNRAARKAIDRAHIAKAPPEVKTVKTADLIHNSESIVEYDPDFARVYLVEKAALLDEALREADPTLWARADAIVRGGMFRVARRGP